MDSAQALERSRPAGSTLVEAEDDRGVEGPIVASSKSLS
jgi:hypothetical protein